MKDKKLKELEEVLQELKDVLRKSEEIEKKIAAMEKEEEKPFYEVQLSSDGKTYFKGDKPSLLTALSMFALNLKEAGVEKETIKLAIKLGLEEE